MSTSGHDRSRHYCRAAGHRGRRRRDAGPAAAVRGARADRRRVRADRQHPRPPADRRRAGHLLGHVERALLLQVLPQAPAAVRREGARHRRAARWHRAERGRRRHRPGLRRHVQDRVAQPPVLCGAIPGRGDRSRRHRPRHPGHGRAAGRGDGRAAVRARGRPGYAPGTAGCGRRHLLLRQLPRPAQHRRRAGVRPVLPRATRWSTRCAWGCCGTRT